MNMGSVAVVWEGIIRWRISSPDATDMRDDFISSKVNYNFAISVIVALSSGNSYSDMKADCLILYNTDCVGFSS